MRIDQKLYEAAPLRGYLHCFRLVLSVQKLCEAVFTSHSFQNPFEIGLMKRVRYFVEVLGQCLRPSTFDDIRDLTIRQRRRQHRRKGTGSSLLVAVGVPAKSLPYEKILKLPAFVNLLSLIHISSPRDA